MFAKYSGIWTFWSKKWDASDKETNHARDNFRMLSMEFVSIQWLFHELFQDVNHYHV